MTIKILEEPHLYLTQSEHDRLWREWMRASMYTTDPQSFEDFVRTRIGRDQLELAALTERVSE